MMITSSPATITENVVLVGPIQYPMYFVRDGNEALVFEGGVGACGAVLEEHLNQLGLARECVKQIVVTHGHPDHVMAVPALRRLFADAKVVASAQAAASMANEKAVGFFCKYDGMVTDWLLKTGAIGEKHRPGALPEMKIPVDALVKEGETISVGGLRFEVLATPGHSDCHLSFYEASKKVLIASDATGFFMPELGQAWWPAYFGDYGQYMNSMRRLATLDVEILCLGHNAVITGAAEVKAYLAASIAFHEAYHQRIVDGAKAGRTVREMGDELAADAHPKAGRLPLDFFQKSCQLLVKNSLKSAGIEAA